MLYCIEIQQLIYNIASGMEHMTFLVQFIKSHTIMSAYHVTCGKVK